MSPLLVTILLLLHSSSIFQNRLNYLIHFTSSISFNLWSCTFSIPSLSLQMDFLKNGCGPATILKWKFLGLFFPLSLDYLLDLSHSIQTLRGTQEKPSSDSALKCLIVYPLMKSCHRLCTSDTTTRLHTQEGDYRVRAGSLDVSYAEGSRKVHLARWRVVYLRLGEKYEQNPKGRQVQGEKAVCLSAGLRKGMYERKY